MLQLQNVQQPIEGRTGRQAGRYTNGMQETERNKKEKMILVGTQTIDIVPIVMFAQRNKRLNEAEMSFVFG